MAVGGPPFTLAVACVALVPEAKFARTFKTQTAVEGLSVRHFAGSRASRWNRSFLEQIGDLAKDPVAERGTVIDMDALTLPLETTKMVELASDPFAQSFDLTAVESILSVKQYTTIRSPEGRLAP